MLQASRCTLHAFEIALICKIHTYMKNFKELRIWQKGIDIAANCYKLTSTFPSHEKLSLISQVNRAAVSIAANIAEGSSRSSEKDYARFIEIALGSTYELETHLIIAGKLNIGDQQLLNKALDEVHEEQKMLTGFMSKLKR